MQDTPLTNLLLAPWDTSYGLPPFDAIRPTHFEPAFEAAMRAHRAELDAIAANPEPPGFDNTIAAFDASGRLFARIDMLFANLAASATSPELQAVERAMAAPLAAHANAIYMHAALFARIDAVHAARREFTLDAQQLRLVERVHLDFVRAGACLPSDKRLRYGKVMEQLAELTTQFAQNVLADENGYSLVLRTEEELAGLPAFVRAAARQAARERGIDGDAHVITLSRSSILPFLTFSERRDLREQAWRAWTTRGEHDGAHDNRPIAREILALRNDQARAHGYSNYADYALGDSMALTQDAVMGLLEKVWAPAKARAQSELDELCTLAHARGDNPAIEAWDWRYYAEKLRQQRYQLDEAQLKPYFPLERMVQALFDCALRLFGVDFVEQPQIGAYHPDVKVYEVRAAAGDGAGKLVGIFLHDNFARAGKRSGAWMSSLRWQSSRGPQGDVLPIILNNNNFAKGSPGEPTLLSFDDARALFHEFGHGLHGLLSNVGYDRLSGVQVLRDFVELPSQLFEHWLFEPQVLKRHARHVQTGEPIPDALIDKIRAAERFNQGYETVRYTASALLDMAAHAQDSPEGIDITAFEQAELARLGVPPAVGVNHRLAHFQHLFSTSGYAAGYYVYMWAEVLEADAFDAFRQAGDPFDPVLAKRLRDCIYSAGNAVEPGATFRAFRGRAATVEPMLRERGLLD